LNFDPNNSTSEGDDVVTALSGVEDEAGLVTLMSKRPDLFGATSIDALKEVVTIPGAGRTAEPYLTLLEELPDGVGSAWRRFQSSMEVLFEEVDRLRSVFLQGRSLTEQGKFDEAIELGESTIPVAYDQGHWDWAAELHTLLATCFRLRGRHVRTDIDEAIKHMTRGAGGATDLYMKAEREMNLAALYGIRRNDDPTENAEMALRILETAVGRLDEGAPPKVRVMALNNLMRGFQTREEGDRLSNLRKSLRFGEKAEALLPAANDPECWALVEINLAETTRRLIEEGEPDTGEAEKRLRGVADAERIEGLRTFIGVANAGLGELHLTKARNAAINSGRIGLAAGELTPPTEAEHQELETAKDRFEIAIELIDQRQHGWQLANALDHLAEAYGLSLDTEQEIETYRRAMQVQDAVTATGLQLRSGFGLGLRLADRGEWAEAAAAFVKALDAAKTSIHSRLQNIGREVEMRKAGNIARWAAFALAKIGETEAAIIALENGRTQDVRRRLGADTDEATLSALPEEAREDYLASVAKLSSAPAGKASDAAARELQEVITAIRALDGFENFGTGVSMSAIADAAEPDMPLLYINPTPWGAVFLSVSRSEDEVETHSRFLESASGEHLVINLMPGDREGSSPKLSYFELAAGSDESEAEEKDAVDHALSLLGPYAEGVAEHLSSIGAPGATLISSGPIAEAPLHAATWIDGEAPICLIDRFELRRAPSAALQAACLSRAKAAEEREPSVLALGNPDLENPELDLAGAQREVSELAERFPPQRRTVALRGEARADFFIENVAGKTHIHLACHASSGLSGYEEAVLHLADRPLSGEEMETLPVSSRLTVVSACQTAHHDMSNLPDEASSISTALLLAGTSAVITTQWPVDDEATTLLMSRFYDELLNEEAGVPEALRRAQLWLRDSEPSGQFSHPLYWAPFVLVGA
jgi:tetratricopeptide (TPR) repeat protein